MKNNFKNAIVLITGADGGIGSAFIAELLTRGVNKLYISGINIEALNSIAKLDKRLIPIKLDITNIKDIDLCVNKCVDINIIINNAGIELKSNLLEINANTKFEKEVKVNFIGAMQLTNNLISTLSKNNNAQIINILSIASLVFIESISTYCITKMAFHIYTQSIRKDLANKVKVFGVYPGYVDTSLVSDVDIDKISPVDLVKNICDDVELDKINIFPDKMAKKYEKSTKLQLEYF